MLQYFLPVPTLQGLLHVRVSSLLYIEAADAGKSCVLVTPLKRIPCLCPISKLENMLPVRNFCRIHTRYLIAMDQLISFDSKFARLTGAVLPIGPAYSRRLQARIALMGNDTAGELSPYAIHATGKIIHGLNRK